MRSSKKFSCVFVYYDAFTLKNDMKKPFRQPDLDSREKKKFNFILNLARRIVKNAFRILSSR